MKKGLVLEGGAMRGLFTAGALDVMMEAGLTFDGLIGVSAGAAFEASPMEFHMVATDVSTGDAVYRRLDKDDEALLNWIRASASMPFVFRVVEIDGEHYLDGALADSIPLAYFEHIGYDRNIVILTNESGYEKHPMPMAPAVRLALRKYPKAAEALLHRHEKYNETLRTIAEKEARGEILVIRPEEKMPIKRVSHDEKKLSYVYQMGRNTASRRLEEIHTFLEKM